MKRNTFILAAAILITVSAIIAQRSTSSYADNWKKVEQFASKDQPESALKLINTILKQARQEHRTDEIIKGMVCKMRFTLDKEPDKAPELIREFETFTNQTTDPAAQALLHSMTAELYAQYYNQNSWTINERTEINGTVPDDLKEWTKNMFLEKVLKHLEKSLEKRSILLATNPDNFKVLLWKGKDSRKIEPSMFEFLLHRQIQVLETFGNGDEGANSLTNPLYLGNESEFLAIKELKNNNSVDSTLTTTYQQLLSSLSGQKSPAGLVIFNLERLEYFRKKLNRADADSLYIAALKQFEQKYHQDEISVEILAELAGNYLRMANNDNPETDNDGGNIGLKKEALQICNDGINRFAKYERIAILKNIREELLTPELSVTNKNITDSKTGLKLHIKSKNLSKLELKLYRIETNAVDYYLKKKKFQRTLILDKTIAIDCRDALQSTLTEYHLKSPDYGIYEFQLQQSSNKSKEAIAKGNFIVTDLAFIARQTEEGKKNIYVLNRLTGHPVPNVEVVCTNNFYTHNHNQLDTIGHLRSNATGACKLEYSFTQNISQVFFLRNKQDRYFGEHLYTFAHTQLDNDEPAAKLNFMTDRAIYRPGQTVHFKLISYFAAKTRKEVNAKANFDIELKDANAKVVSVKKVQTNEYGSASGTFVLPEGGLSGYYSLNANNESYNFRVEEYKRPTFEVELEKPKTEIRFGDKTTLNGTVKSYAGYNVANAQIKYRIARTTSRFCWWIHQPAITLAEGTTSSDANGKFVVPFNPEKTNKKSTHTEAFNYTLYINATDTKGETQQGEMSVSVSDQSLFILANIPNLVCKDAELNAEVSTKTVNDEQIKSTLAYKLLRLAPTDEYSEDMDDNYHFTEKETVLTGEYQTTDKYCKLKLSDLPTGRYKLIFSGKDKDGKEIKSEKVFVLYSNADKRPPVKSYVWQTNEEFYCQYGDTAHLSFGTSTQDTKVLYEVMKGNTLLESKWIDFSNEIKHFHIPFVSSYGAGINVVFTFIKEGKLYSKKLSIQHKNTDTKLDVKLSTFRNKLLPGEKTTWTINVAGYKNQKVSAEVLASMYDASLDVFGKTEWYFNPAYNEPFLYSPGWSIAEISENSEAAYFPVPSYFLYDFDIYALKWFGLSLIDNYRAPYFGHRQSIRFTTPIVKKDEEVFEENEMKSQEEISNTKGIISIADVKGNDEVNGKDIADVKSARALKFNAAGAVAEKKLTENVAPRTNFNETAFFYPQLQTDSAGNVQFSFTAPESLTRWNVMMLAHTKDLYFGQAGAQVVTQKELMVQMNLPRFVRRSDKLNLTANVVNLSDKAQNTTVTLEVIDPATNKALTLKEAAPQTITLAANETKVVNWSISEFSPYELVICKVVARSEQFSDGEQKYLPVLPDKVLLTESQPLVVRSGQTRDFRFENLIKNGSKVETKNLTIEFSSNPVWYAVQALPTVAEPKHEDAISLFTAYYANTLAGWIAASNPKLSATFSRWKNEGGSRETLLSNLEKNAELKNMLLEETPWVMAAQNETEQKRQIALLLDLNNQKNKNEQYLSELQKLQLPSGGFTWFSGMRESQYITQWMLLYMARLDRMTGSGSEERKAMIVKALDYVDREIAYGFAQLKKNRINYLKENCTGEMELFYLLMRSEYPHYGMPKATRTAVNYYLEQAQKFRFDYSIYGKAMMALVFKRNGNNKTATEMLQSLRENALKTDDLGMYWAKNTPGYFWNERPIAVQAAIIDAYRELAPNSADLDEMKIWLLKQKQTQSWDSPTATVDAIYALLNNGSDWLSNNSTATIHVAGKEVKQTNQEVGTAYFKQNLISSALQSVKPENMGKIRVSSPAAQSGTGIGWGAMYWQYYQNQAEVEAQGGALKITKSLYVVQTNTTKEMIPIGRTTLHKGDKVITRLVVTTDRNMEYVALKDLRAACFEPVNQLSGCEWKEGVCYYQSSKDASTQYFFSFLPKGTYVFEYELWVNNSGTYTSGITTLQCQYAPEFVSHSGGEQITVK